MVVVPDSIIDDKCRTLQETLLPGHPGASELLNILRSKYYAPSSTHKVQDFIDKCEINLRAPCCSNMQRCPLLGQIYDQSDATENVIEVDLVGQLPAPDSHTRILTTWDVLWQFLSAVLLKQTSSSAVTPVLTHKLLPNMPTSRNIYWLIKALRLLPM